MGTRHLTCVRIDDEYKVAQYGQWDGYPSGQGVDILSFLRDEMDRDVFIEKLRQSHFGSDEEIQELWIECGAEKGADWVSTDVSDRVSQEYPQLSRDTGSDILRIIQSSENPLMLKNSIDFVQDSLFCEYCYVIDFDKNTFEVFTGFNTKPLPENERFYDSGFDPKENQPHRKSEYHPVKFFIEFSLDDLPNEDTFLEKTREDEEE